MNPKNKAHRRAAAKAILDNGGSDSDARYVLGHFSGSVGYGYGSQQLRAAKNIFDSGGTVDDVVAALSQSPQRAE